MDESQLPRVERLAVDMRQGRRLRRRAETVLAFAKQGVAAHRGLHPNLIAFARHKLHLDERRPGERLGHLVTRLRVAPARVPSVRLALAQRRGIPGETVAPTASRRRGPSEHDGEVDALRCALPELGLQRVTRRWCPREQDQSARVAVDAMHDVRTRAWRMPIAIGQQVHERRFLAVTARERLNQEAGRLVDDHDGLVFMEHAQQVPVRRGIQSGRPASMSPGDPSTRRRARRQTPYARREPRRRPVHSSTLCRVRSTRPPGAPGAGVGPNSHPPVQPHPGVRALDDPLAHQAAPRRPRVIAGRGVGTQCTPPAVA